MTTKGVEIYKKAERYIEQGQCQKTSSTIQRTDAIYVVLCFLLSRAMMFGRLCPFGLAYFTASFTGSKFIYGCAAILLGALTAGAGLRCLQYSVAFGFVCLFKLVIDRENEMSSTWSSVVVGAGNFIGGFICMLFGEFLIYDLLINAAESILIGLVSILFTSIKAVDRHEYKNFRVICRQEMLGVAVLLGLAICGLSDVVNFGSIHISEILWSLLTLSFAWGGGLSGGLCAGVSIGLIASMSQTDPLGIIGIYTVCGFSAGLAQRGGKIVLASIYLLTAVAFGISTTVFAFGQIGLINYLVSALLFVCIPKKIHEKYFSFSDNGFSVFEQKENDRRMNTLLAEKFMSLADAFSGLSETIENLSVRKEKQFALDYGKVIDDAVDKVCSRCSMRIYCWDKESENTCRALAGISAKLKARGHVDVLDFEEGFRKGCIGAPLLISAVNNAYLVHRLNAVWDFQVNETRTLLGAQYKSFADVMADFSKDITQKVVYESKFKSAIHHDVAAVGHEISEVYLFEREDESYDVELRLLSMEEPLEIAKIEKVVSSAMHRKMRVSVIDEYNCAVRLEPEHNYFVMSSVATVKKDGEEEIGDSYAVFNIRDNRCVLILSDGMGSGKRANAESRSAVRLLKKLFSVGFNIDAALQLVNSALVLKAGTESFATLDIAVVDLFTGEAEFVKVGAAKGYVLQKGGVYIVRSNGLPAGIMTDTNLHKQKIKLSDGDSIVLLSDGVDDAKTSRTSIVRFLEDMRACETEETARQILNYALKNRQGKADDDMTVLVAKIAENKKSKIV